MPRYIRSELTGVMKHNKDGRSRQDLIKLFMDEGERSQTIFMEREPEDPFNTLAVKAYIRPEKDPWGEEFYLIGNIRPDIDYLIAVCMDLEYPVTCNGEVTGGWSVGEPYGVNVTATFHDDAVLLPNDERIKVYPYQWRLTERKLKLYSRFAARNKTGGTNKRTLTTLLLAIFLGWSGAHHFYNRRYDEGILYAFTLGCVGLGWVLDIILISIGKFKESNGTFLRWKLPVT